MIKGPQLKEMLNNMSEEELNFFTATILTDKSVVDSILAEAKYNINFSSKIINNDLAVLKAIEDALTETLVMDVATDCWYNAYADLDDPYGYNDAWECFISEVDEKIHEKVYDSIAAKTDNE